MVLTKRKNIDKEGSFSQNPITERDSSKFLMSTAFLIYFKKPNQFYALPNVILAAFTALVLNKTFPSPYKLCREKKKDL